MNIPYLHYIESRIALQEAASNRAIPFAEWLRRYNECKAASQAVRRQWWNNAVIRQIGGKYYQRCEQERQRRVKAEQRKYVRAMSKFLGIAMHRSAN